MGKNLCGRLIVSEKMGAKSLPSRTHAPHHPLMLHNLTLKPPTLPHFTFSHSSPLEIRLDVSHSQQNDGGEGGDGNMKSVGVGEGEKGSQV